MREVVIIAHNVRSTHNIGSLLRTAEGLGVAKVYLTGYTPYPQMPDDVRLPHESAKLAKQIHKTALGAEDQIAWKYSRALEPVLTELKKGGFLIAALEQHEKSIALQAFKPPEKIAIILGREVDGLEPEIIEKCDVILEIPMHGKKESFNVVQAAAMALYHLMFMS